MLWQAGPWQQRTRWRWTGHGWRACWSRRRAPGALPPLLRCSVATTVTKSPCPWLLWLSGIQMYGVTWWLGCSGWGLAALAAPTEETCLSAYHPVLPAHLASVSWLYTATSHCCAMCRLAAMSDAELLAAFEALLRSQAPAAAAASVTAAAPPPPPAPTASVPPWPWRWLLAMQQGLAPPVVSSAMPPVTTARSFPLPWLVEPRGSRAGAPSGAPPRGLESPGVVSGGGEARGGSESGAAAPGGAGSDDANDSADPLRFRVRPSSDAERAAAPGSASASRGSSAAELLGKTGSEPSPGAESASLAAGSRGGDSRGVAGGSPQPSQSPSPSSYPSASTRVEAGGHGRAETQVGVRPERDPEAAAGLSAGAQAGSIAQPDLEAERVAAKAAAGERRARSAAADSEQGGKPGDVDSGGDDSTGDLLRAAGVALRGGDADPGPASLASEGDGVSAASKGAQREMACRLVGLNRHVPMQSLTQPPVGIWPASQPPPGWRNAESARVAGGARVVSRTARIWRATYYKVCVQAISCGSRVPLSALTMGAFMC